MCDSHRVGSRIYVMTIPLIRRLNCLVVGLKKIDTIVERKAPTILNEFEKYGIIFVCEH